MSYLIFKKLHAYLTDLLYLFLRILHYLYLSRFSMRILHGFCDKTTLFTLFLSFFLVLVVGLFVLHERNKKQPIAIPAPVDEGYSTIVKYEGTGAPMVDINIQDQQPLLAHPKKIIPDEQPADISEFIRSVSIQILVFFVFSEFAFYQ